MTMPKREQAPPESVAHDHLRAFVERIERMHQERRAIGDDIKEIYAEAKGIGFDTKALKIVIRKREQDPDKRAELEAMVDIYEAALGMANGTRYHDNDEPDDASPAPARAHVETIEQFPPETAADSSLAKAAHAVSRGDDVGERHHSSDPGMDGAVEPGRQTSASADADPAPSANSNVTQLRPEKRITFNDKPHVDCLDPGQCGGFSNLGLCPRCKAVAGGGAAEIEHHGSVA